MSPTIYNGDILIYKPIDKNQSKLILQEGDIVIAKDPLEAKNLIVKRIYKKTSKGFILRGDNHFSSTDSRQFGTVNFNNLHGVVERILSNPFI